MNGFTARNGILHAEDVPLPDLAAAYGTPLYIYSAGRIRHNVTRLRGALAGALPPDRMPLIAYACKANGNLAVLALLAGMGLGCDTVSGGEIARALRAGIPAPQIVYSGVGKSAAEIASALESGIGQFNVESAAELERIAAIAQTMNRKAPVAFRMNPDIAAGAHDKISTGRSGDKFGLPRAEIMDLYKQAAAHPHLVPRGLHMHIGSQILTVEPFRKAYEKMAAFARDIRAQNLTLHVLDLGGGFGIVYEKETPLPLESWAAAIRDIILPLETDIVLEPGRFIVGDAGLLLTSAGYIKESGGKRFVVLDAGMNDLMRPSLYGARHPLLPVRQTGEAPQPCDLVGPVCETGDTFAKDEMLPPLREGDLAALTGAGAYGFSMASTYNTRPLPAEILVDGARHALIRRRGTVEDILKEERIPDWMAARP